MSVWDYDCEHKRLHGAKIGHRKISRIIGEREAEKERESGPTATPGFP